jgi:hypothetical protein
VTGLLLDALLMAGLQLPRLWLPRLGLTGLLLDGLRLPGQRRLAGRGASRLLRLSRGGSVAGWRGLPRNDQLLGFFPRVHARVGERVEGP